MQGASRVGWPFAYEEPDVVETLRVRFGCNGTFDQSTVALEQRDGLNAGAPLCAWTNTGDEGSSVKDLTTCPSKREARCQQGFKEFFVSLRLGVSNLDVCRPKPLKVTLHCHSASSCCHRRRLGPAFPRRRYTG